MVSLVVWSFALLVQETAPAATPPPCVRSDVLVTVRGEQIDTRKNGYRLEGSRYLYRNAAGALVALRASEVDLDATRRAHQGRCQSERALVQSVIDDAKAKAANPLELAAQHDDRPAAMVLQLEGDGRSFTRMMLRLGVDQKLLDAIVEHEGGEDRLAVEVLAFMMDVAALAKDQAGSGTGAMIAKLQFAARLAKSRAMAVSDSRIKSALYQVGAKLEAMAARASSNPEAVAAELRAIVD